MYAAINGHYEAVKFLIGAGASIEEKDDVSERMFIRTIYIYMCVCVCGGGRRKRGTDGGREGRGHHTV